MAAITTTTFHIILEAASGHRMVQTVGRTQFVAKAKTKTLTTDYRRMVYGTVNAQKPPLAAAKTMNSVKAVFPYLSTTNFTQTLAKRKIVVNRVTCNANASGCIFTYSFIGY
ncbi:MAG: hypothetical protein WC359_13550 [Dehalococcoidia bacterium]|jgi:hypothetical protein